MRELETAAENLAAGDLAHRVEIVGPAEVAALGDAFNSMADSLEQAENLRRRLVADVAHELRNPIAAARAQAEGMAEGVLVADSARLDSLVDDLQHLSGLVDDLQDLAVAEAGRMHYEFAPVDLNDLALREGERARATAREGVDVIVTVAEGELLVRADERRLSQVLRNLLTNATRHTTHGSVTVSVTSDDGLAVVRVTDTGEGIPASRPAPHLRALLPRRLRSCGEDRRSRARPRHLSNDRRRPRRDRSSPRASRVKALPSDSRFRCSPARSFPSIPRPPALTMAGLGYGRLRYRDGAPLYPMGYTHFQTETMRSLPVPYQKFDIAKLERLNDTGAFRRPHP